MPIFRRQAPARSAPADTTAPKPELDALLGDAAAHAFLAELSQGHWQGFHDFLESERDPDTRYFYANNLAHQIQGRPGWIDEWCEARAGSTIPLLFRGLHNTAWAWQARGSGLARSVQQDSWPLFHERLVAADKDLSAAAAMNPDDPTPRAGLLMPAVGLSLGQAELRRRFDEVERRHRWHLGAYRAMSQGLAAKWGGSNEGLLAFARTTLREAPDGHPVHVIIPTAHLEVWLRFTHGLTSGKPERAEGLRLQRAYFQRDDVRAEVRAAADKSIRSRAYVPIRATPGHRNVFAMCFSLTHDYAAQLEQMELIGPLIQRIPWGYQGSPADAYERARVRALSAMQTH